MTMMKCCSLGLDDRVCAVVGDEVWVGREDAMLVGSVAREDAMLVGSVAREDAVVLLDVVVIDDALLMLDCGSALLDDWGMGCGICRQLGRIILRRWSILEEGQLERKADAEEGTHDCSLVHVFIKMKCIELLSSTSVS